MIEELNVVTGAFGYSGNYIKDILLKKGIKVRTLTSKKVDPAQCGGVEIVPWHFDNPSALVRDLEGATVLYNTYWVRFDYGDRRHETAVENTKRLIETASAAGVRRIVHVSITNPSEDSPLPYFRGKAILEREIMNSGLSYAILRPTVLFGGEDILINNIAWFLRRIPVFGVFGDGMYRIQPVLVGDLAGLAVSLGEKRENIVLDAVGPEIFTYRNMVESIREAVGGKGLIMKVPPSFGLTVGRVFSGVLGDVVITKDEISGLMAGLLVSSDPPTCHTKFSEWLRNNKNHLGLTYRSELRRHYNKIAERHI